MKQLTYVLLLITAVTFSQSIKVKKGKVLYNKEEVATIENPYRDHYAFKTLNGENIFTVDLDGASNGTEEIYHYLKIQSANGNQNAQIEYEVLVTSLNPGRIIAHLLAVKYKVFNEKGIAKEALNKLFAENKKDLENKYTTIVVASKQRDAERKERAIAIRNQYYPQVQANKSITFTQGGRMRIVGRVAVSPTYGTTQDSEAIISIYDLDGTQVAQLNTREREMASKKYTITTWDNNSISYTAERYYSKNNNAFLQEIVIQLLAEGYMLEHQIKQQQRQLYKAKVNLAAANSSNLYWEPGKVTDKEGKVYSGNILIAFERLDINQTGENLPEYGADNYGAFLYVKYRNNKGNLRTKKIQAQEGVVFNVVLEGSVDYYYALSVKGEAFKKLQNIDAFKFNSIYFYKLLKKNKHAMLLQDPAQPEKYVIKTKTNSKGQMIDNRTNEKLSKKLANYLSDCVLLSEEIKQGAFDVKIEDNLYQIIAEYETCKQ